MRRWCGATLFALGSACGSDAPAGDQGEGATTTAAVDDDDGGDGSVTTYAPKIDIPGDDSPSDPTTGLPPLLCPAGGVLDDLLVLITDGRADERATLEGVSVVGGDLHVVGASDADVDFLECLDEVRGEILIDDNRGLVDLAGTSGIEMIGSDLTISRNPALVDLEGFLVLGQIASQDPNTNERFPGSLYITQNASLERIVGFEHLSLVYDDVHVTGNPELTSIEGLQLQGVGGALVFDDNPKLCRSQIDAFVASLVTVGSVTITGNADDC